MLEFARRVVKIFSQDLKYKKPSVSIELICERAVIEAQMNMQGMARTRRGGYRRLGEYDG
jgi:hypothetical protein